MHLKNFSLIETVQKSEEYVLSAAYDMLSTNVVIPEDKEQLALTANDKKQNLHRKDFLILAENIGNSQKSAEKIIDKIAKMKSKYIAMCQASYIPEDMKQAFEKLITERMEVLLK